MLSCPEWRDCLQLQAQAAEQQMKMMIARFFVTTADAEASWKLDHPGHSTEVLDRAQALGPAHPQPLQGNQVRLLAESYEL